MESSKKQNANNIEILLDSRTRQETILTGYAQPELLNNDTVEAFLTTVGVEVGQKDETYAQSLARKIIRAHSPGELKKRFDSDLPGYTRADLNNIYLDYLIKCCDIDMFTAFGSTDDDQLWYAFFPNTLHTCQVMEDLPKLTGNEQFKHEAMSIRRKQLCDLFLLGDLFNLLFSNSDICFIDSEKCKAPPNAIDLFGDARQHVYKTNEKTGKCTDIDTWMSQKSYKYNTDWIKNDLDCLAFFDPASVRFTKKGMSEMMYMRMLLFEIMPYGI